MSPDVHIASLVVHAKPECADAIAAAVRRESAAELVASERGKLVVLAEAAHEREIVALTTRLGDLPGVLGVSLVYHHIEPAESLLEEVCHGHDPA